MPYIKPEGRAEIDNAVTQLPVTMTVGDVNYAVTRICDRELTLKGVSYTNINSLIGVLECAKAELYRRLAAPYEDKKIAENGDAYANAGRS